MTVRNGLASMAVVNQLNGTVLLTDHTGAGGWAGLVENADKMARAFNDVLWTGHELKSWHEVVDASKGEL